MTSGLQVFDAAGRITLDVTERVCKILGTVSITAGSSGSVSLPDLQGNQPFVLFLPTGWGAGTLAPSFNVGSTSISWYYPSNWSTKTGGTLVYGIF